MNKPQLIYIPDCKLQSSIGDVLLSALPILKQMDDAEGEVIWDFQNNQNYHPFLLDLIAVYKDMSGLEVELCNLSKEMVIRTRQIRLVSPLMFSDTKSPDELILQTSRANLMPLCKFDRLYQKIDKLQSTYLSELFRIVEPKAGNSQLKTALSYLLGELICNVQEHSWATQGYLSVQPILNEDALAICVADNGITIYGSYTESNKSDYHRIIAGDEVEAIKCSTKGFSTKNRPDNESRGYGISTNLDMVVNGLHGDFFVLSGKGMYRRDCKGEQFINLPDDMSWGGTIFLIKVPVQPNSEFDVYDFIE